MIRNATDPQLDPSGSLEKNGSNLSFKSLNLRRLLGYLKPYRTRMALATLFLMITSGLGLIFPLFIVRLLESVTRTRDMGLLNLFAGILVGIFLLQGLFSFLQTYLLSFIGERIVYDLRTRLYKHLHELSFDFFATQRVGDLVSRMSSDVTQMRSVLTTNVTTLFSQVMMLIGSIVIMLTLNARITLVIIGLAPLLMLIAIFFGKRIEKGSAQVQDQLAHSTVVAEEGLQGVRVVKSFGRETYETQRYNAVMEKTFLASLRVAGFNAMFSAIMMFLSFCSIAAIMWYGGREVLAGRLNLAMITGFLIYGISIAMNLTQLSGSFGQLSAALGGVQRVFELLDMTPSVQDTPGATALVSLDGRITFQNVSFSYNDEIPVLHNISLEIQAGEILALVGLSGAGKSTLFNLIPRFYDPSGGNIKVDGCDIRTITQQSLRSHIAIVPQETILFGGTVRENILYGRLDATEEDLVHAARAAHAHEFIEALPNQYDNVVGERGANLSGGQRQRIAIARAILKDPRILLLDEATSSLDNESEGLVQDALSRLMQNRTTVIIAHRLSTIKVAHRIAVVDAGRIIELGTHAELMQNDGMYSRLYLMQFRDSEAELV